ncbi:MAG: hypothetical protein ABSF99_08030 [Anaerolineales bacterium]|jgi:hypothetical protein
MLPVDYVSLQYSAEAGRAALREISGQEEWMVQSTDTLVAIQLLDHLLLDIPGTGCKPGSASQLTAADRDRMLAVIYRRMYGGSIATMLTCGQCKKPFDLDFELGELEKSLAAESPPQGLQRTGGTFQLPDGSRFRLPTGCDELEVAHMSPDQAQSELLQRCLLAGDPAGKEAVLAAMQVVAPLLDLDLQANCPECGFTQAVHFDLQRYLLSAIQAGQTNLAYQVHLLASAYGWSLETILGLPRSQRLAYVNVIENHPLSRDAGVGR